MITESKGDKGYQMEEVLRNYFLDLGYFVVCDVKFTYQGFDVTDVDLWIYMRPSSLTRERINIDVKNRRTPQAIERIFWAKGLQQVLNLDGCIVATTDKRDAVRTFGLLNEVTVLDGTFLARLSKYRDTHTRLTEKEFFKIIQTDELIKLKGDWRHKVERAKTLLLTQLDYSGCNIWLKEIAYFMEQVIVEADRREIACRIVYLITSFFLIGLDYIFKDISFLDNEARASNLRDGFKHGALGKTGTQKVLSTSMALIEGYLPSGRELANLLRRNVNEAYDQIPTEILKEYFSRPEVSRKLFQNARRLEFLAYSKSFLSPPNIEPELQAILGVILDFSEIERRQFFDSFRNTSA